MIQGILSKVISSLVQKLVGVVVEFIKSWLHNKAMDKLKTKSNEANVLLKNKETRLQGNKVNEDILSNFS